MHRLDSSFRLKKQAAAERRRRRRRRRLVAGGGAVVALAVVAASYGLVRHWSSSDLDENLRPTEASAALPPDASVYVPTLIDLPGDPMLITLSGDTGEEVRKTSVPRPEGLAGEGIPPQVEVLSDRMLSSSERFMTTIPSTQQDFAFFQAQRAGADAAAAAAPVVKASLEPPDADKTGAGAGVVLDPQGGWSETIGNGSQPLPKFRKTKIANNTSVADVIPETLRFDATQESFVKILHKRSLEDVVLDNHYPAGDARAAAETLKSLFGRGSLEPGDVVAMRGVRADRASRTLSLRQVSVYSSDAFIGTLARENGTGPFVSGVDPWVRKDLFNYSGAPEEDGHKRQYRLLDAIYSAAARNNVPASVIGEAIMYLSRGQDLNAFATADEQLTLVYSEKGRSDDGVKGRVLYVGIRGDQTSMECFVYREPGGDFACISGDDVLRTAIAGNGMVTPVDGVLTATFGPSKHPVLDTVRMNKGVDWAAPAGTPVVAAFDGKVVFMGDAGGYGNLVRLQHPGGGETRYAHLQGFAAGLAVGSEVKAGTVIGRVGATGLATGPGLHFELYRNGVAVDPLAASVGSSTGDAAVDTLTSRIIHVESGGSARAKNPLSSATGLGQFIDATWLRMMNTYRPDLASRLSTAQLLDLRYDPTISREMVRNLAREGEAYLKSRGQTVTAGRLYLCHFLGMEGAGRVLAAPGDAQLVAVLGQGVISANPFLAGKSAAYVIDWAERKMGNRAASIASAAAAVVRQVKVTSPEFLRYRKAIDVIVASAEGPGKRPAGDGPASSQAASGTPRAR